MNSYGTSGVLTIHWGNHFKRIHEEGKIANNTLKMADNHLLYIHSHYLLWHGDRIFPYFDFDNMNFVKDRIEGIAKTKMYKVEAKMKEFMSAKRNSLDA